MLKVTQSCSNNHNVFGPPIKSLLFRERQSGRRCSAAADGHELAARRFGHDVKLESQQQFNDQGYKENKAVFCEGPTPTAVK